MIHEIPNGRPIRQPICTKCGQDSIPWSTAKANHGHGRCSSKESRPLVCECCGMLFHEWGPRGAIVKRWPGSKIYEHKVQHVIYGDTPRRDEGGDA